LSNNVQSEGFYGGDFVILDLRCKIY
jgi:hypothetical protein